MAEGRRFLSLFREQSHLVSSGVMRGLIKQGLGEHFAQGLALSTCSTDHGQSPAQPRELPAPLQDPRRA